MEDLTKRGVPYLGVYKNVELTMSQLFAGFEKPPGWETISRCLQGGLLRGETSRSAVVLEPPCVVTPLGKGC